MIEDGLFERFPCDSVYALHNWPDCLSASYRRGRPDHGGADRFDIVLRGRGGHAAQPHHTPDAILAGKPARRAVAHHRLAPHRPGESAVLSVTRIEGGHATTCCRHRCRSPALCAASTPHGRTASRPRCAPPSRAWRWPAAPSGSALRALLPGTVNSPARPRSR
jgi:hippurate hydrolase